MDEPAGVPHRIRVELPAPGPEVPVEGVALVTLDRPDVLNAIDTETLRQLVEALERLDAKPDCRAIVLTGAGSRAFAAGADIREMAQATPVSLSVEGTFPRWDRLREIRSPLIAAVRGYALGGGCELAMACDVVICGDDAVFGQPEVRIGVMPGAGGTQRLVRAIGKSRAMEMILTGRTMPAREAEAHGLVSRVVAAEETLSVALALAAEIAALPPLAVRSAKASVNRAFELSLGAGLEAERQAFFLLFATEDQAEGMRAFLDKRPPAWRGR
jgi:enoyl-CoA hydratase